MSRNPQKVASVGNKKIKKGTGHPPKKIKITKPKKASLPSGEETKHLDSFPIVGIGASAGGLEAFSELLRHLPVDTGMGFVLVQHLAPTHESILPQLLAKTTAMPVHEAKDKMRVERNHVYVIPENAAMTIVGGILKLGPREKTSGRMRSIDCFLQSLAVDRGMMAIAVVLSGTDFDGSAGVEAIKGEGGITFAQEEKSAKFDAMPRHAVETGYVDIILPPGKIAEELGRIAASLTSPGTDIKTAAAESDHFKKILLQLRVRKKVDLTFYKPNTIKRRIRRRMVLGKINHLSAYVNFLNKNPDEIEALYQDVLINVTGFFRDPKIFDTLKQKIFPQIVSNRSPDEAVRVWVAGCSTGQEAYSVAMAFLEFAAKAGTQIPLQIFATDLNEANLEKARTGRYHRSQLHDVSAERIRRFFTQQDGSLQICKPIREMCVFARHNVVNDPPFSRMDLVTCRNLLIYLEPPLQKKVIPVLHYALKPDGFAVLGVSETVGEFTSLFSAVDKAHKIYSKKSAGPHPRIPRGAEEQAPVKNTQIAEVPSQKIVTFEAEAQREADRVALQKYAPVGAVVDSDFNVVQFRGATGRYLEAMPGKASFNVLKMAREGLLMPLRVALTKAKKENVPVRKEELVVRSNGHNEKINLEVIPLKNTHERSFLILFESAARQTAEHRRLNIEAETRRRAGTKEEAAEEILRLQNEVTALKEYLQTATEQYEATNEEIQASNEEAHSANEELQSINEELETTKEELESTNEELQTVNDEMGIRNVDLNRINNDLNNVLTGAQMCIVVLGSDLCLRRFTPLAEKVLNLVPTDVGRPIAHIRPNLQFPDLEKFIMEAIDDIKIKQTDVQDENGRWYSMRVLPYKTQENKIDGAVLVLSDIDALKRSEENIKSALDYAQSTLETVREPMLVLNNKFRVESANRSYYNHFRVSPAETLGKLIFELGNGQWKIPKLRSLLEEILPENNSFDDFEVNRDFERIGHRSMLLNARRIASAEKQSERILLAIEDITERKAVELLRDSEERYRTIAETLPQLVWTCQINGECDYFNSKYVEYTGVPMEKLLGEGWRESINPIDRERTCDYWIEAIKGKVPYDLEFRIQRADGVYRWFKIRATPLRNKQGEIIKWFGTSTDIDENKRSKDELEKTVYERTARLRETVEELESFSYSVSHDMRAPLRAMQNFSSILLEDYAEKLDAEGVGYLEKIKSAANRQDALIQDVLIYTRVLRSEMPLHPVDTEKLVNEIIETYPEMASPKAEINIKGKLPVVKGNSAALTQIFSNLIGNAVKFVPPDVKPRIKVWAEEIDSDALIWIEDNGIGIEPKDRERIFRMFERVAAPKNYSGTGIGLAIVRKAVERMHGKIGVESEPRKGSRFWVQLPRA